MPPNTIWRVTCAHFIVMSINFVIPQNSRLTGMLTQTLHPFRIQHFYKSGREELISWGQSSELLTSNVRSPDGPEKGGSGKNLNYKLLNGISWHLVIKISIHKLCRAALEKRGLGAGKLPLWNHAWNTWIPPRRSALTITASLALFANIVTYPLLHFTPETSSIM